MKIKGKSFKSNLSKRVVSLVMAILMVVQIFPTSVYSFEGEVDTSSQEDIPPQTSSKQEGNDLEPEGEMEEIHNSPENDLTPESDLIDENKPDINLNNNLDINEIIKENERVESILNEALLKGNKGESKDSLEKTENQDLPDDFLDGPSILPTAASLGNNLAFNLDQILYRKRLVMSFEKAIPNVRFPFNICSIPDGKDDEYGIGNKFNDITIEKGGFKESNVTSALWHEVIFSPGDEDEYRVDLVNWVKEIAYYETYPEKLIESEKNNIKTKLETEVKKLKEELTTLNDKKGELEERKVTLKKEKGELEQESGDLMDSYLNQYGDDLDSWPDEIINQFYDEFGKIDQKIVSKINEIKDIEKNIEATEGEIELKNEELSNDNSLLDDEPQIIDMAKDKLSKQTEEKKSDLFDHLIRDEWGTMISSGHIQTAQGAKNLNDSVDTPPQDESEKDKEIRESWPKDILLVRSFKEGPYWLEQEKRYRPTGTHEQGSVITSREKEYSKISSPTSRTFFDSFGKFSYSKTYNLNLNPTVEYWIDSFLKPKLLSVEKIAGNPVGQYKSLSKSLYQAGTINEPKFSPSVDNPDFDEGTGLTKRQFEEEYRKMYHNYFDADIPTMTRLEKILELFDSPKLQESPPKPVVKRYILKEGNPKEGNPEGKDSKKIRKFNENEEKILDLYVDSPQKTSFPNRVPFKIFDSVEKANEYWETVGSPSDYSSDFLGMLDGKSEVVNVVKPSIKFKKVDKTSGEEGNFTPLKGAEFVLKKKNENGVFVPVDENGVFVPVDENGEFVPVEGTPNPTKTSDEKGIFGWDNLDLGEYEVWETKAPLGYRPIEKVANFKVEDCYGKGGNEEIDNYYGMGIKDLTDKDGNKFKDGKEFIEPLNKDLIEGGVYNGLEVFIKNEKIEYPLTGGSGSYPFILVGFCFMTYSIFEMRRRLHLKVN